MQPIVPNTIVQPIIPLAGEMQKASIRPHGIVPETEVAIRPIMPEHSDVAPTMIDMLKQNTSFIKDPNLRSHIVQRRYKHLINDVRNAVPIPHTTSHRGSLVDILV